MLRNRSPVQPPKCQNRLTITLLLLLCLLQSQAAFAVLESDSTQQKRQVSYSLTMKNNGPDMIAAATVKVFAPNKETSWQKSLQVESNHPFEVEHDAQNNQMLSFLLTDLPPYGVKIITVDAKMMLGKNSSNHSREDTEQYLQDEPWLNISHPELRAQAERLAARTPLATAENIYHWASDTLSKTGYSKIEHGALHALRKGGGDCTEFMHLFMALCRINQIPTRGVSGFIVTSDQHLSPNGLHDWAEVYVDGAWRLADPFYEVFMAKEDQYLTMRVHALQENASPFRRWQSSNPNILISMAE